MIPKNLPGIGVAVTKDEDINAITRLIAKAESDSHTWQVDEDLEKYMEAYDRTEALELQLARRMEQGSLAQVLRRSPKPPGKLHALDQLARALFAATDGPIGRLRCVLFDERSWAIRYLVVKTGTWLSERDVFISPGDVEQLSTQYESSQSVQISLTREGCSAIPPANMNLRSSDDVIGYEIQACDSSIGHVEDFLFDDTAWSIRSLVVNTRNWWPGGERVLIATYGIDRIDRVGGKVHTKLTREQVSDSPAYQRALILGSSLPVDTPRPG
jgi:hypothetical protein